MLLAGGPGGDLLAGAGGKVLGGGGGAKVEAAWPQTPMLCLKSGQGSENVSGRCNANVGWAHKNGDGAGMLMLRGRT